MIFNPISSVKTIYMTYVHNYIHNSYLSGAHEFTPCFSAVRVARSLVFYAVFCRSLFVLFLLASDYPLLASDYPCWRLITSVGI